MCSYTLAEQELFDLQVLHREATEKKQADRVKAIILLGKSWTPSQVAEVLLINRITIRTYYRHYKKGGVKRLLETNYSARQDYLTPKQEQQLDTSTRTPPHYR